MLHSPEFWVAAGFVILVAAIARPAARQATAALDARAARIRAALDEARGLRDEAERLLAEYQGKQRDADRDAQRIVERARADARRIAEDAEAELDRTLERREAAAREKIARAEEDALRRLRAAAIDTAIDAAGRVIAGRLTADRADALVEAAAAELPSRLA